MKTMFTKLNRPNPWTAVSVLTLSALLLAALPAWAGQEEEVRETFSAFAVAMGTSNPPIIPSGRSTSIQITITRWSTPEERGELLTQLIENGQEALVKTLQKQEETGFARATGPSARGMRNPFPSERLRYAWQFKGEEGRRRIVLALDRYISMAEAVHQPRWRDYDMTLIVLDVDAEGKGEGQLAMGVRLAVDRENKKLVIENFGTEPIRLTTVHKMN
jgi:hypothetical protein